MVNSGNIELSIKVNMIQRKLFCESFSFIFHQPVPPIDISGGAYSRKFTKKLQSADSERESDRLFFSPWRKMRSSKSQSCPICTFSSAWKI